MSERGRFPVTQYAAIFDDEKRLLMLKDSGKIRANLKGKWVFPGGHIDTENDLFAGLERELMEETRLKLEKMKIFHSTIKNYVAGPTIILYYLCSVRGDKIKLDEESDEYTWVSIDDIKRLEFRDNEEKEIVMGLLGGKYGDK